MGYDRKYGTVTTERGDIPDDEPVFLIRGKDASAVEAIHLYAETAEHSGADSTTVDNVHERAEQIRAWQREHPDRVKVPDTVPGQIVEP